MTTARMMRQAIGLAGLLALSASATRAQPVSDVNALNREFVQAAWKHDRKQMVELLDRGADINAKGINGNFALQLAIGQMSPDLELVKLLLERGADVNLKNDFGDTPLTTAIHFGSQGSPHVIPIVKLLLDKGANIHTGKDRALLMAAGGREVEITKLLLAKGAKPGAADKSGKTALMAAAASGSNDIVKALLEKGADANPNAADKSGTTLLMYAARGGNIDLVRRFIERGGDVKAVNADSETVIMHTHDPATIKLLVAKGADINAVDKSGRTALLRSVEQHLSESGMRKADAKLVEALLDAGANVNRTSENGGTPLLMIVDSWPPNPEVVQLLLKKGADVKIRDKAGASALKLAREKRAGAKDTQWAAEGFDEIISLLVKAGTPE